MIRTKYVVGDVVVVNGKQAVVIYVAVQMDSLYTFEVDYKLSNGCWYTEVDI